MITVTTMTPTEAATREFVIYYSFAPTQLGEVIVASTPTGICMMDFVDDPQKGTTRLRSRFPRATLREHVAAIHATAMEFFVSQNEGPDISLHLCGTPFRIAVWKQLLKIPRGQLSTYGSIAAQLNAPGASRAVGTAVGSNPVSVIVPCHRVVRSDGKLGGYAWGVDRKAALLEVERAAL